MSLTDLHNELRTKSPSGIAFALDSKFWEAVVKDELTRAIVSRNLLDLPTPLSHIKVDATIDAAGVTVDLRKLDEVVAGGLKIVFTLRVEGVAQGSLSTHELRYTKIGGKVIIQDNEIRIRFGNAEYGAKPPDTTNPHRKDHLDALEKQWGWSHQQVEYFLNVQEPSAALVLAATFLSGSTFTNLSFLKVDQLVPFVTMQGSFLITPVHVPGIDAIAFVPSHFERNAIDPCSLRSIGSQVSTGTVAINGTITIRHQLAMRLAMFMFFYLIMPAKFFLMLFQS
jgi:hypothetical protein